MYGDENEEEVEGGEKMYDWPKGGDFTLETCLLGALPRREDSSLMILHVGVEVMANVLSYLPPPEALRTATAPVCKDWQANYANQRELWKILCLQDPFGARMDEDSDSDDDDDSDSDSSVFSDDDDDSIEDVEDEIKRAFGSHRVMYSRLVRCQRYIGRIREDALAGRPPSVIEYVTSGDRNKASSSPASGSLQGFLARASCDDPALSLPPPARVAQLALGPVELSDDGRSSSSRKRSTTSDSVGGGGRGSAGQEDANKRPRYGKSDITDRLLGPSGADRAGTALPWTCAIYSIVNWMTAFQNVRGVQTLCLGALPCLMEDEQQRMVARRAGLAHIVLRSMVRFPDSVDLQAAALHTIVLLARPIGGREGQIFSMSSVTGDSTNLFSAAGGGDEEDRNNGIEVVLGSMRRFRDHEALQAVGCWSLVNLALAPGPKALLIQLGGVSDILAAMTAHPNSADVQFRGLFSLINLVVPTSNVCPSWLLPVVGRTTELVVASMRNFCSNVTILNRASLVLHNLSLTEGASTFFFEALPAGSIVPLCLFEDLRTHESYHDLLCTVSSDNHAALLLEPDCFHLLEWCIASYPTDNVLQQSATATLQRLQATLSQNEHLRARFAARHAERRAALEEVLLPDGELFISDSEAESDDEEGDGGPGPALSW
jgi:hypothetical protein